MLQWMGGSRRKVTTSRKSTQKRQKQYFEQRKQQQQEAAFTENNAEGLVTSDHQKRNRSLDILSLLNVSRVTEECKPLQGIESFSSMTNKATCGSSAAGVDSSLMRKSGSHAFSAGYHTSTSNPITMTDELVAKECTVPTRTGIPSLQQMGRVSLKSTKECISDSKNKESEYFKNASSIHPSIFDIIGDDGAIGTSEGEPVPEAHVAFSIEGLGKIGNVTPMQSPQHPESIINGEKSSFSKAAKNLNSCKIFNAMLDDLEMGADDEKLSCHNHLSDVLYPSRSTEHELSTFKDGIQHDGKQWEINSLYDEDRHDNIWKDSSPCLDDYQVDEKCGVSWKKHDANNNSFTWRDDSSDLKFERCQSPSSRCQEKMPDSFHNLDRDCRFPSLDEPKYPSFVRNYHAQDRFSPVKPEDTRDVLTSFSGESCSSTAVGCSSTADTPSAKHRRRYGKDLSRVSTTSEGDYNEGMWNVMAPTSGQGNKYESSWKHMRSSSSRSKSALYSQPPVNEHEGYCLFEEEFPLRHRSSHPGSSFSTFEKNQHWGKGDSFGLDTKDDFHSSKCFYEGFEEDTPNAFPPENLAFHQPFRSRKSCNTAFISRADYGESSLDPCDFEVHVQSSNSSEVFGETESAFPAAELSAQGSATEEGGDKLKNQPPCPEKPVQVPNEHKYMTTESRLPTQEISSKDYAGSCNMTSKAISQEVVTHAFDVDADNELNSPIKELQGSIPVLCEQKVTVCFPDDGCFAGNKGMASDNIKGSEPKTVSNNPYYQLMTVERYVVKLFGVPKRKSAVWNDVKLF